MGSEMCIRDRYKKDSLWQSEHVDAVVHQDAQRVIILHGPVAARFSTELDEPANQILGGIHQYFISRLAVRADPPSSSSDPDVSPTPSKQTYRDDRDLATYSGVRIAQDGHVHSYTFTSHGHQPPAALFRSTLAGTTPWLQAALVADRVFSSQRRRWMDNPIKAAMKPGPRDTVEVLTSKVTGEIAAVTLLSSGGKGSPSQAQPSPVLRIAFCAPKTVLVTLTPQVAFPSARPSVILKYDLAADEGGSRLYEQSRHQLDQVQDLYRQLWLPSAHRNSDTAAADDDDITATHRSPPLCIDGELIRKFEDIVRRVAPSRISAWKGDLPVPLDACVVLAWEALISPLMSSSLRCDFLRLLHQSVDISQYPSVRALTVTDVVEVASRITAVVATGSGRRVEVSADILRDDEAVVNIKTTFFLRGATSEVDSTQVEEERIPDYIYKVDTDMGEAILRDRGWLRLDSTTSSIRGRTIVFRLIRRTARREKHHSSSLQVSGAVLDLDPSGALVPIGSVHFEKFGESDDAVLDFLRRHGSDRYPRTPLPQPGWSGQNSIQVEAPIQSRSYALASADFNPIHTDPVFARFAGLPGTVVHGMNTSAIVKRLVGLCMLSDTICHKANCGQVQNILGDAAGSRFQRWKVKWEDMVTAGEALRIELQHSAMERGAMILEVNVYSDRTGNQVMSGEATVEQPSTAYVFCGQGSQKQNMGMKLYEESAVARTIWDRGEKVLQEKLGFSILNIVRENPRQLRIKFGGKRGRIVRENYLAMASQEADDVSVVPGITVNSLTHTFSDDRGLLFSTQFSQPAV